MDLVLFILPIVALIMLNRAINLCMKLSRERGRVQCMMDWCDYGKTLGTEEEAQIVIRGLHMVEELHRTRNSRGTTVY